MDELNKDEVEEASNSDKKKQIADTEKSKIEEKQEKPIKIKRELSILKINIGEDFFWIAVIVMIFILAVYFQNPVALFLVNICLGSIAFFVVLFFIILAIGIGGLAYIAYQEYKN